MLRDKQSCRVVLGYVIAVVLDFISLHCIASHSSRSYSYLRSHLLILVSYLISGYFLFITPPKYRYGYTYRNERASGFWGVGTFSFFFFFFGFLFFLLFSLILRQDYLVVWAFFWLVGCGDGFTITYRIYVYI